MYPRILLLALLLGSLTGCSTYPLGHSGFGPYFGGLGPGPQATNHIPAKVQSP